MDINSSEVVWVKNKLGKQYIIDFNYKKLYSIHRGEDTIIRLKRVYRLSEPINFIKDQWEDNRAPIISILGTSLGVFIASMCSLIIKWVFKI